MTRGISFLLSSVVFHVVPTALEITMVCAILVRSPISASLESNSSSFDVQ
jgi:ABC-type transport system involved in Fe-S cluster assembly fused permease/ATPase subunit